LCGIDPDSCDTDLGRANQSLGSVEAELLRRVNPRISNEIRGPREVPTWVRDYLGHAVLVPHGGTRFGLSPKRVDDLREMSREAVRRLDFAGYDVVGDLKELIPPDDLPEARQPEDSTETELLEAALDTIAVMLENHRDVAKDRNKWRAKARRLEQRHAPGNTLVRRVRRGLGRARAVVRAQVRKRL
jgi:hypothetical protein